MLTLWRGGPTEYFFSIQIGSSFCVIIKSLHHFSVCVPLSFSSSSFAAWYCLLKPVLKRGISATLDGSLWRNCYKCFQNDGCLQRWFLSSGCPSPASPPSAPAPAASPHASPSPPPHWPTSPAAPRLCCCCAHHPAAHLHSCCCCHAEPWPAAALLPLSCSWTSPWTGSCCCSCPGSGCCCCQDSSPSPTTASTTA